MRVFHNMTHKGSLSCETPWFELHGSQTWGVTWVSRRLMPGSYPHRFCCDCQGWTGTWTCLKACTGCYCTTTEETFSRHLGVVFLEHRNLRSRALFRKMPFIFADHFESPWPPSMPWVRNASLEQAVGSRPHGWSPSSLIPTTETGLCGCSGQSSSTWRLPWFCMSWGFPVPSTASHMSLHDSCAFLGQDKWDMVLEKS